MTVDIIGKAPCSRLLDDPESNHGIDRVEQGLVEVPILDPEHFTRGRIVEVEGLPASVFLCKVLADRPALRRILVNHWPCAFRERASLGRD